MSLVFSVLTGDDTRSDTVHFSSSFYLLRVRWLYKASTQLTTSIPPIARALSDGPPRHSKHTRLDTHTCKAQTSSVVFVYRGSGGTAVKGPTLSRCQGTECILFWVGSCTFLVCCLSTLCLTRPRSTLDSRWKNTQPICPLPLHLFHFQSVLFQYLLQS